MGPPARPVRNVNKPATYSENGTRRSSATVQAEREATASKKAQQDEVAKKASKSAAQRESESQERARRLKENPGRTPAAALPPKADRTRPARTEVADTDGPEPKKRKIKKIIYESEEDDKDGDDEDREPDPQFDAEMRELEEDSGGSDIYVPHAEEQDDEESDRELDIELEDDECDTALDKRHGGKKKGKQGKGEKPGVHLRKAIRTYRDGSPDTPTPRNGSSVQKGSKASSHEGRAGMRPNYKPGQPLLPNLKRKAPVEDGDEHEDEEDDGPMQQEGELFGDVEQDSDEREELMKSSTGFRAITKFANIDSSSKYLTKTAGKQSKAASESSSPSSSTTKRPKVVDLPECAKLYWKPIKAHAIDQVAGIPPWAELSDAIIVQIWNDHLKDDCPIDSTPSTDKKHQLFRMVKSLLINQVLPTEWRFKLRDAGVKAVMAEWDLRKLTTKEQRAHFAHIMLGVDPRERAHEDRPFVYSSTDDSDWDGDSESEEATPRDGVLEGRMVLRTLAVHYEIVGSLVPEEKRTTRLYGALGLAIQAVNRALEYSLTGVMVIPDQKTGHFSAENWADYMSTTEKNGKTICKHVRRATMWIGTMEHCPDAGWKRIIDGAKAFSTANLKKENKIRAGSRADAQSDNVEMPEKKVIGFNSAWATPASGSSPSANV